MILGKERIIEGIGKGVIRISSVDKTKPFDMGRQVQKSSIDLYLDLHDLVL